MVAARRRSASSGPLRGVQRHVRRRARSCVQSNLPAMPTIGEGGLIPPISGQSRRMMPKLLAALEFRSNNGAHRPLLDALDVIRRAEGEGRQYFRTDELAIEGVIRPKWRDLVIEDAPGGGQRINRINYEICVLQTLRKRLRCKEIWVAGADRFRNPDEDLPADFADRRAACYGRLGLPLQASDFVEGLRVELADALRALDHGMPRNPDVRLDPRRRHPIIVSPLDPQPEPPGLAAIKAELGRRWPMTGLLDVVKEADLRTDFTKAFATAARARRPTATTCAVGSCFAFMALARMPGSSVSRPVGTVTATKNCCTPGGAISTPTRCERRRGAWSTRRWRFVTPAFGVRAPRLARRTASIS